LELAKDLGGRTAAATSEPRATFFFSASVADVAVQRGNAVAVKGTRADDMGSLYDIA